MCHLAEKKKKKPKHTNLVLPGEDKRANAPAKARSVSGGGELPATEKRRWPWQKKLPAVQPGQVAEADSADLAAPAGAEDGNVGQAQEVPAKQAGAEDGPPQTRADATDQLPPNAIRMPVRPGPAAGGGQAGAAAPARQPGQPAPGKRRKSKKRRRRLSPVRRKRRRRLIQMFVLAAVVAVGVFIYTSGIYLNAATLLADMVDGIRIAARPGDGFPISFSVQNYIQANQMGGNGFAVLGQREAAIVSSTGLELRRVTHGYLNVGMSAGNTRMVVYNRGGREYIVEGRSQNLARRTTLQDIQFCEMSPGGWLAVVTSSRYRSTVYVYGPTYDTSDPVIEWSRVDEKPMLITFNSDNRGLALGCYLAQNGAFGSNIYLLRTDSDQVQATIWEADARVLRVEYLAGNRILAVFDTFAAVYDSRGKQLSRYDYDRRSLLTDSVYDGMTALVFGSDSREDITLVLLNNQMEPQFEVQTKRAGNTRVLAARNGAWLLTGQNLLAYDLTGALLRQDTLVQNTLGLVYGGEPLALTVNEVLPISEMLQPPEAASQAGSTSGSASSTPAGPSSEDMGAGSTSLPAADSSLPSSDAGRPSNPNDPAGETDEPPGGY